MMDVKVEHSGADFTVSFKAEDESIRHVRGYQRDYSGVESILWPSSLALCTYIFQLGDSFWQGKYVVELGAGLALPSKCVAQCGAKQVIITDREKVSRNQQWRNDILEKTEYGQKLDFMALEWGRFPKSIIDAFGSNIVDVLIGSDLIYELEGTTALELQRNNNRLLATVVFIIRSKHSKFIIATHLRSAQAMLMWHSSLDNFKLKWKTDLSIHNIVIYTINR